MVGQKSVKYLGLDIGNGEVGTLDAKIKTINNLSVPRNKRQLMKFLGMVGYYRRFCPHFSSIASPLTELLKKNKPFIWGKDCDIAFSALKDFLSKSPVLRSPNFDKEFTMSCDASNSGIGAVLLQESEGTLHPIAYFSKKFNAAQTNYSTIEKECLALVLGLQHFDIYLSSCPRVRILSDHSPLSFLMHMKNTNQRLTRWALIQRYNLIITHIPGSQNILADTLSRIYEDD